MLASPSSCSSTYFRISHIHSRAKIPTSPSIMIFYAEWHVYYRYSLISSIGNDLKDIKLSRKVIVLEFVSLDRQFDFPSGNVRQVSESCEELKLLKQVLKLRKNRIPEDETDSIVSIQKRLLCKVYCEFSYSKLR